MIFGASPNDLMSSNYHFLLALALPRHDCWGSPTIKNVEKGGNTEYHLETCPDYRAITAQFF